MNQKQVYHYIDKKEFYDALCEYQKQKEKNDELPIPRYIADCFIKICENLANKGNFVSYTWKDEMIGDGIENCIRAIKNFDSNDEKKNPFGYFTIIAYWAFVRRIKVELKQQKVKYDQVFEMDIDEVLSVSEHDSEIYNHILEGVRSEIER